MIQKAVFIILRISLLIVILGFTKSNATEMIVSDGIQVESQILNHKEMDIVSEYAYFGFFHPSFILSEISMEEDQSVAFPLKLSIIPTPIFKISSTSIALSATNKSKALRLLEVNMTPVQNVSRTILFKSLKIYS